MFKKRFAVATLLFHYLFFKIIFKNEYASARLCSIIAYERPCYIWTMLNEKTSS